MEEKKSIFVLADKFLREAQGKSEYVDIDSAAIYSDKFIGDFVNAVYDKDCDDFDLTSINRMRRILVSEQFDYDYLDEERNLYSDAFIKHFKRRYLILLKQDIVERLSEWKKEIKLLDGEVSKFVDDNFWDLV